MDEQTKATKKKKIFLYLRIGFVFAGVLLGVIWVCREKRYVKLGQIIEQMNPLFVLGIVIVFALSQVILATRWWVLLRTQGVHLKIWTAVRLHFLGLFYNNFMPGSLGGDVIRAWYVTLHTNRRFEAALSVFVDRLVGFASSILMAGFFYFVLLHGQSLKVVNNNNNIDNTASVRNSYRLWVFLGLGIVALAVVMMLILPAGRRLTTKIGLLGVKMARKLWTAIVVYSRNPLSVLAAFGLTFVLQGIVITGFWLIGRDIGISASAKYYFVFFPLTWAVGAIPISVGGAGVVELGLVYFFMVVGVEAEKALALALCQRVVWMVAALPGAFVHLAGAHLPKEFSIDQGVD
jgi:uncharacterized protein (TIRG00374 family)